MCLNASQLSAKHIHHTQYCLWFSKRELSPSPLSLWIEWFIPKSMESMRARTRMAWILCNFSVPFINIYIYENKTRQAKMSVWKILICHVKSISYLLRINKNTTFLCDFSNRFFHIICDLFCAQTMNSHWEFSIRFVVVLLYVRIDHTSIYQTLIQILFDFEEMKKKKTVLFLNIGHS